MLTRRILLALSGAALAAPSARAQDATGFVVQLGNQLTAVVNGGGSYADKKARLAPLIEQAVDVDGIARFCLGRFWRAATPEQQAQYQQLFRRVLLNNVFGKLGEFQGVTFAPSQTTQTSDGASVGTIIRRPNQQPNNVQWIVSPVEGQLKIVDVKAEGVSLRQTQRNDYSAFLTRNNSNVDALIGAMRGQVTG